MRDMKKVLAMVLVFTVLFMALASCTSNESEQVKLVRSMMALDYETMSVGDFNAVIEKLCEDVGTSVPAVYNDVTTEFAQPIEGYGAPNYNDEKLETFMTTTLQYSSTEISAGNAGDIPAHMNIVMYVTAPGMTAQDMEAMMQNEAEAQLVWALTETLDVFPILVYYVEGEIHDTDKITVSERDIRVSGAHAAVKEYFLSLGEDVAMADTLEDTLSAEFERLSAEYSDDTMTIRCVIQGVEREGDLEADG